MAERTVAPPRRVPAETRRPRDHDAVLARVTDLDVLDSPGRPLSPAVQVEMATRFGHDVSRIRVHTDDVAADLTEALDAQAVTVGRDVYFGRGAFEPQTTRGGRILAHELAHAVGGAHGPAAEVVAERAATSEPPPVPDAVAVPPEPIERLATVAGTPTCGTPVPDPLTAGEALVRLVLHLLDRDGADHSGRLRAVLARLAPDVRDAVLIRVRDDRGGTAWEQLQTLTEQPAPPDGGATPPEAEADAATASEAAEAEAASTDEPVSVPEVEQRPSEGETAADEQEPAEGGKTGEQPVPADAAAADEEEAGKLEQPPAKASLEPTPGQEQAPAGETVGGRQLAPPKAEVHSASGAVAGGAGPAEAVPAESAAASPAGTTPGAAEGGAGAAPGGVTPDTAAAATPSGPDAVAGAALPMAAKPGAVEPAADGDADAVQEAATEPTVAPVGAVETPAPAPDSAEPAAKSDAAAPEPAAAASAERAPEQPGGPEPPEPPALEDQEQRIPAGGATAEPAEHVEPPIPSGEPAEQAELPTSPPEPDEQAGPGESTAGQAQLPDDQPGLVEPVDPVAEQAERVTPSVPTDQVEPATQPEPGSAGPGAAVETATVATAEEPVAAEPEPSDAVPGGTAPQAAVPAADVAGDAVLDDPPAPSGGGGGGGAIADPPQQQPPDVSGMDPTAALGAVAHLPATKLAAGLTGVRASAKRTLAEESADLTANPPSMRRPSGVPGDRDASLPPAEVSPLPEGKPLAVQAVPTGVPGTAPQPTAPPVPGAPVIAKVPEPRIGGDAPITTADAAKVQAAVQALPTTDPALDVDAGPVPELELSGDSDPKLVGDQAAEVETTTAAARTQGIADVRAPMGENDVYPQVPEESIQAAVDAEAATAQTSGGGVGGAVEAGTAGGGDVPDAALDAVAAEKGGDQITSATQEQGGALDSARTEHDESVRTAHEDSDKQINEEISKNAGEQTDARKGVRTEVAGVRREWVGEQNTITGDAREAADKAQSDADTAVGKARTTSRDAASEHIRTGNEKIGKERANAERDAREQRRKAEQETSGGGFFSWLGSKVKSFFDGVRKAIGAVFDAARKAVDVAIKAAQKLAVEAIEAGRKLAVAAIELGGKALMAAGDLVLAGFPKARDKFRKKIADAVGTAKKVVNDLADALKAGVQKLLDLLGSVLKGALSLLEKAYLAAVDAVAAVVNGVLKAAQAWISALAEFAAIAVDVAKNPGQWLRNLGASLLDGVRNHVWPALKQAVKDWFKAKVEEVIGVGKMILDVLRRGGITFTKIVKLAWTAIKEALPGILIQILIEKLIAMLIPAAGALSLIIDGLRAAWGAAGRILTAFQKFIIFLKAVRPGGAGSKFGDLVAAAAIAVIDFVANFALVRLKGAGSKVGGTLRKMAEGLMKATKKIVAVAKKVVGVVVKAAKKVVAVVKRGVAALGTGVVKIAQKVLPKELLKLAGKTVKALGKGVAKSKQLYGKAKAKIKKKLFGKGKKPKKPEKSGPSLEQRIERTRAKITQLLERGVARSWLWLWVKYLAVRHKWRRLGIKRGSKTEFSVRGDINPVDLLVAPGQQWPLLSNPYVVSVDIGETMSDFGSKPTTTPAGYEVAAGKMFASLLQGSFPGREVVQDDRRYIGSGKSRRTVRTTKSTARRVVISPQLKMIKGERLAGEPRLDYLAVVGGKQQGPGGITKLDIRGNPIRDREKDVVHIFEPTTMVDFLVGKTEMHRKKQGQALNHLLKILTRKEFEHTQAFVYTIIMPARASAELLQHLSEVQQSMQRAAPGKEIFIVHRTVAK